MAYKAASSSRVLWLLRLTDLIVSLILDAILDGHIDAVVAPLPQAHVSHVSSSCSRQKRKCQTQMNEKESARGRARERERTSALSIIQRITIIYSASALNKVRWQVDKAS